MRLSRNSHFPNTKQDINAGVLADADADPQGLSQRHNSPE
jgi:hypothetical protein